MKEYPRRDVRNVAIIAHHGAGKTSLAEGMLFLSGATQKLGKVDDGSSILDYELEEQNRRMSINSHVAFYEWNDHFVNLVDTPGFANFLFEAESALRVVDGTIEIVSAITGVKAQTQKFWQVAADLGIPRVLFMNKLDRERASFENGIADIEKDLGIRPVPITIPIGEEENFKGVVDVIEMKAHIYGEGGKYSIESIPKDLESQANVWRERLVESVAEINDELLEKYLGGGTFDNALIYKMLREGVLSAKITPVYVGSAVKLIGINLLMDGVFRNLPSPLERPSIKGQNIKGKEVEKEPTVLSRRDEETKEFLLSGTGQVHVEITVDKLKNKYGVNVEMKTPKVPYKETIKMMAKAEGKYIKQTGGRGQYGDAWLQVKPLQRSGGYEFVDRIVGGVIPKNFIPSVEKGVKEAMHKGILAGYPVVDVKVTLFDGKYHPVDSSDIAFKIAGSMGFKKAMEMAQPVIL